MTKFSTAFLLCVVLIGLLTVLADGRRGGGWKRPGGKRPGSGGRKPGGNNQKPANTNNGGNSNPTPSGSCSCGCKKTKSAGIGRIVGGSKAEAFSWPWQIRLVRKGADSKSSSCGGSLIADNWVLTASHCVVKSNNAGDYTVYAGMYDISEQKSGKAQSLKVSKVVKNPNYKPSVQSAGGEDIALIQLSSPPDFNDKVQKVCLSSDDSADVVEGNEMTVTGWGKTSESSGPSSILKQVNVKVLGSANGQCETDKEICAPHKSKGGFYKGDSGGPLVRKRGNNWYQFGIVSGNRKPKDTNSPTVYSRVTSHCSWIKKVTGLQICK